jgi:hypothetical protein
VSLCLASTGAVKALSLAAFTLVWTHSIEKIDWQEDWRITPAGLELVQARVKGSGAGRGMAVMQRRAVQDAVGDCRSCHRC